MKFSILQQDLFPAVQSVSRSCGIRATLPVLANILVSAQGKKIKLSATNLELGVVKIINAKVMEDGEVTVPAKTLLETVASLSGEVNFESEGEQLNIISSGFSAKLNGIASSEFPPIPLSSEDSVLIGAKELSQSLPKISFAAATDEGRPILTGILTQIKKGGLELVATDGFRLAHQLTKVEGLEGESFEALIPKKTFDEVVRLISEEDGVDKISITTSENQNQMIFKINQTSLSSRLIEGQFPAWEKIIPTEIKTRVILERAEFLKAVKLSAVFAKDSANIVKLETKEKGVSLTSETKELGGQETQIEASVEGDPIVIAFNSKFLIDALSAPASAQVLIEFAGNLAPCLIKPIGEEGLEYVIMPVRLS